MNKQETLDLFDKGREEWNKWAESLLNEKKLYEEDGTWAQHESAWENRATADFSGHVFDEYVDFSHSIFPGKADFFGAKFNENVFFHDTIFKREADFNESTFKEDAYFRYTIFKEKADFSYTTFEKDVNFCEANFDRFAEFYSATFKREAYFGEVIFSEFSNFYGVCFTSNADFGDAKFSKTANFHAIRSERGFDLAQSEFKYVPNFIQAHFSEAPGFENIKVPMEVPKEQIVWLIEDDVEKPHTYITSHYRALKRLAIQAHDHAREQDFFAGELKSQLKEDDTPKPFKWMIRLYGGISDFGRSMFQPVGWWLATCAVFMDLYFGIAILMRNSDCSFRKIGDYFSAPLLSLKKGLFPLGNMVDDGKDIYKCLYGQDTAPYLVMFFEMLQTLISLPLIFLFLLAVRAKFRIR